MESTPVGTRSLNETIDRKGLITTALLLLCLDPAHFKTITKVIWQYAELLPGDSSQSQLHSLAGGLDCPNLLFHWGRV